MANTVPLEVRVIYNAAALREALTGRDMAFARAAIGDLISDCNAALSRTTCEAKDINIRSAVSAAKEAWSRLDNLIRAALAAPARNCDRFADPGKAWLAYKAECDKNETVPNMIGAISWLFAPVEGCAK